MKKIRYVSEPEYDDVEKYGNFAKEKINITYDVANGYSTKEFYLDNPETKKEITEYVNDLKNEKNKINGKYINKRVKYNAIMLGLSVAIFFTGLGVGNVLISLGLNNVLVSNLVIIVMALVETYGFIYVNQGKFYYKKSEMVNLKRIATELSKCGLIEQKINSLDKNELIDINFRREQINNTDFRQRNLRRNYQMHLEENEIVNEAMRRVTDGVSENLKLNKSRVNNTYNSQNKIYLSDNIYKYKNKFKLTTKRLGRNIGKWFVDAFQDDDYINRREENYVMRGEKRR